jgi:hypothetical protein
MVAPEDRAHRYTVEEWRALLEHCDIKYECHDGWLIVLTGDRGPFAHRDQCDSRPGGWAGERTMLGGQFRCGGATLVQRLPVR